MPDDDTDSPDRPQPFRPSPPLVIGLLGGVAAGKSTVAAAFARHGLRHVDADRHARETAAEPGVLAELRREFGEETVDAAGQLDRQRLAAAVFRDAEARRRLEAILHPPIRAAILTELRQALARGQSVLLDVPLLLENGLIEHCHATVFVAASEATRLARAAARGWSAAELQRREAAQAPLDRKRAAAQFVIDNDGSLAAMQAAVGAVLRQLLATAGPTGADG